LQSLRAYLWEFLVFGLKEARACIFAGSFMTLLLLSKYIHIGIPRYDFLFLAAVALQVILVVTRIESLEELVTLCAFHLVGLGLELFKTHPSVGSWSYPEEGFFKVAGVPLYSGFMYAAVASYMCQAWRILKLELTDYPSHRYTIPLGLAIYANFFTKHWFIDIRLLLMVLVILVFWKTRVYFTVTDVRRWMPLTVSFVLIGFFVWLAENFSTYYRAWVYPQQREQWELVSFWIMTSWWLMVIISFIMVAELKQARDRLSHPSASNGIIDKVHETASSSARGRNHVGCNNADGVDGHAGTGQTGGAFQGDGTEGSQGQDHRGRADGSHRRPHQGESHAEPGAGRGEQG